MSVPVCGKGHQQRRLAAGDRAARFGRWLVMYWFLDVGQFHTSRFGQRAAAHEVGGIGDVGGEVAIVSSGGTRSRSRARTRSSAGLERIGA